jgi:hypothetical protein
MSPSEFQKSLQHFSGFCPEGAILFSASPAAVGRERQMLLLLLLLLLLRHACCDSKRCFVVAEPVVGDGSSRIMRASSEGFGGDTLFIGWSPTIPTRYTDSALP